MNGRAEELRRLIALYRLSISEGVSSELARKYLAEIAKAELELANIEKELAKIGKDGPAPGPEARQR